MDLSWLWICLPLIAIFAIIIIIGIIKLIKFLIILGILLLIGVGAALWYLGYIP
jgi:hypothetical protein